jgi:hypothetical protein
MNIVHKKLDNLVACCCAISSPSGKVFKDRMEYLFTSKRVVAYKGTTPIAAGSGVAEK